MPNQPVAVLRADRPGAATFYAAVFVISGLLMALQLLQARLFSVTTWYHVSFLVISIAMFGLTLGALTVHNGDQIRQRAAHRRLMADASSHFGASIILALVAQLLMPAITEHAWSTMLTLPAIILLTVRPYYFAGVVLSLAMTRAPYPLAWTYGVDLTGAAAGCLAAVGLMGIVDTPSAIVWLAAAALGVVGCLDRQQARRAGVGAVVLSVAALVNTVGTRPVFYPLVVKGQIVPQRELTFDRWNTISRVTVSNEHADAAPFLWGPSPTLPPELRSSYYLLLIDGEAGTPITRFEGECSRGLEPLDYDVTALAYGLPGLARAAIIGVGGGRDVLSACKAGLSEITAIDVNALQISLLSGVEPFRSYAGLSKIPGLRLVHSEARSWFARENTKFDLIQMSLIDTWAATGAGAFALSENGLYTVDAWRLFMDRLNPNGVMTVSRWYVRDAQSEVERLVSLATGSLLRSGAREPRRHIFLATSANIATLVLARDPLTERQLDALSFRAAVMDFTVLLSPRHGSPRGDLHRIMAATTAEELDRLAARSTFDIAPPTDNRPYFFNQVRLTRPLDVFRLIAENSPSTMLGHARANLNLYIILVLSLAMVVGAILWPLRGEVLQSGVSGIAAGTAWFLLIGLGFMFIEIGLLQRLSTYLGHPSYGLAIVLFTLALATGTGSLLCYRFPLTHTRTRLIWAIATAVTAAGVVYGIALVTSQFADAGLTVRALLCIGLTAPLGCLLGFGFPTGMALVESLPSRPGAWMWGVNGAAGVMGSSIGLAINIAVGIDRTLFLGALCYAALVIPIFLQTPLPLAPRTTQPTPSS